MSNPVADPYGAFKFQVKWDGRYVAGVSEISPLRRLTDVISYRSGGDPSAVHRMPGITRYDPIELRRGVTADAEFEAWANQVWQLGAGLGSEVSLDSFRKDIIIEVYNAAGQLALSYDVYRCWVSEYEALAELDARTGAVAVQLIRLENEGWSRDTAVVAPTSTSASAAQQPDGPALSQVHGTLPSGSSGGSTAGLDTIP